MKKIVTFIIIWVSSFLLSQTSRKEIDSLNEEIFVLRKEGKLDEAFEVYKEVIRKSEASGNPKEAVKAYIFAANILSNLFNIEEAFRYLDTARKKNEKLQDSELEAQIYTEYGRIYNILGFWSMAIENYDHSVELAQNIKSKKERNNFLKYLYALKATAYENDKQYDHFFESLKKEFKITPDPLSAARIAKYFTVYQYNADSAHFYLNQAEKLYENGEFPIFHKSIVLRNFGRYYFSKKEYEKATFYYKESLAISREINKPGDIRDTAKLLYEAADKQNNEKDKTEYLELYSHLNDSIISSQKKLWEKPIRDIVKQRQIQNEHSVNRLYLIILALVSVIFLVIFIAYKIFHRAKKKTEKLLKEKEKETINLQKETEQLQRRVNESFEEVTNLAKSNSPEFFTRFHEVYPEVVAKLLEINPRLSISELTLSAYIFLGFTTKDIMSITFTSINTVKSRKYHLRKKLYISAEESTEMWFKNIG